MTTCVECGGPVKTRREKHYRYPECGLPNVVVDGVEITECRRCGETYTGIPAIEGLHRAIAAAVIYKKGRLASQEIKFLRKSLGWSGVDFAKRMGTSAETVSRWEHGRAPMGSASDRLLRLLVAKETPVTEYQVDVLAQLAGDDRPAKPARLRVARGPKGWKFQPGPALVKVSR